MILTGSSEEQFLQQQRQRLDGPMLITKSWNDEQLRRTIRRVLSDHASRRAER